MSRTQKLYLYIPRTLQTYYIWKKKCFLTFSKKNNVLITQYYLVKVNFLRIEEISLHIMRTIILPIYCFTYVKPQTFALKYWLCKHCFQGICLFKILLTNLRIHLNTINRTFNIMTIFKKNLYYNIWKAFE